MSLGRYVARRAAGAARLRPGRRIAGDGPRPPGGWRRRRDVPFARSARRTAGRAGTRSPVVRAVRPMARRAAPARSRPLDALRPSGRRPGRRARVQHRAPGLGSAGVRDADRVAAGPLHRRRAVVAGPGGEGRVAVAAVGAAARRLAAAGAGRGADGMGAGRRHAGVGSRRRRVVRRAAAAPAGAGVGPGAAAGCDARAIAGAIDGRGGGPPVRAGQPGPRALGAGRAAAARLAGVADAGARRLRRPGRRALQRIVRGRDGHGVARPRPAADGRPARPRRLAGRRLRRCRRGAARGGDAGDRRHPLGDRSAGCSGARRDAAGAAAAHRAARRRHAGRAVAGALRRDASDSPSIRTPRRCARISTRSGVYFVPLQVTDLLTQQFQEVAGARVSGPWQAGPPVFLLGADALGRDVFSRTLHGARASLGLALVATLGTLLVGALLGAWAGLAGGRVGAAVEEDRRRPARAAVAVCDRRAADGAAAGPAAGRRRGVAGAHLRRCSAGRGSPAASRRSCASRRSRSMCWPPRRSAPHAGGC